MPSRNVVCFLRVRIYYTIALKRGVRTHWPITGSLTTIDNSRWTSDSRWHIFFEPTSKLMMYLLSLQSIKEMTEILLMEFFSSVSVSKIGSFLVLRKLLFATLRLRGWSGRDGCQSALWDCFGWRICRYVEKSSPKQSHNALDNHLDPVSRATSD